jgi:hypothetical protein
MMCHARYAIVLILDNSEFFKLELGMGRLNLDTKQLFSIIEHQEKLVS